MNGTDQPEPAGAAGPAGTDVRRRPKRPIPVTILAIFQLAQALLYSSGLVAIVLQADTLPIAADAWTLGTALGVVAVIQTVSAIGLLRQHTFGWTLAMLTAGVSLATQIATWWTQGTLVPPAMLLSVVTVLYLNQVPVRATFGLASRHEVDDFAGERG